MLALAGCAPRSLPPSIAPSAPLTDSDAAERWQDFIRLSAKDRPEETLSGSLRFGTEEETHRVTYLLWADNAPSSRSGRAIRLDIGTGLGSTVGRMLFVGDRLTLVLPGERRAYIGEASQENLRRLLGLSLPFGVQQLNDFLAGRFFSALDSPEPEGYEIQKDGNIVYRYRKNDGSIELELDARAMPVRWQDRHGWKLDIVCDDAGLPSKLSGQAENLSGRPRLVLLVKERRSGASAASFELAIPSGFTVFSLDQ